MRKTVFLISCILSFLLLAISVFAAIANIDISPKTLTLQPGYNGTVTVTMSWIYGDSASYWLTCSGFIGETYGVQYNASDWGVRFNPNPIVINPGGSNTSIMRFTVPANAPFDFYKFNVIGAEGVIDTHRYIAGEAVSGEGTVISSISNPIIVPEVLLGALLPTITAFGVYWIYRVRKKK